MSCTPPPSLVLMNTTFVDLTDRKHPNIFFVKFLSTSDTPINNEIRFQIKIGHLSTLTLDEP